MPKKAGALDPKLEQAMIAAIRANDPAKVTQLLADGYPIDAALPSEHKQTALGLANQLGATAYDAAIALLDGGANWRKGGTNLLWAVHFKNQALTRRLIDEGADVNHRNRFMQAPLVLSAGDPLMFNISKMLIEGGADVNDGALTSAVDSNNIALVELLFKSGAELPEGETLLVKSVYARRPEIAKALLAAGADVNERASFYQWRRKSDGKPFEGQPDFDEMRNAEHVKIFAHVSPLILAAATGQHDLVKTLIDAGADLQQLDAEGNDALAWAKRNKQTKSADILEKSLAANPAKANPSFELLIAAQSGDLKRANEAMKAGADINTRDSRPLQGGLTPLMHAARGDHAQIASVLLDAGAEISLADNLDTQESGFMFVYDHGGVSSVLQAGYQLHRNALHWAADAAHSEVGKILIERGADLNGLDRAKMSPLMMAASSGATELAKVLLAKGANPDDRGIKKRTALMIAARAGHLDVVKALIAAGAKVDLQDGESTTALIDAASRAISAVVELLLQAGADVNLPGKNPSTAIAAVAGPSLYDERFRKSGQWLEFRQPKEEILKTTQILIDAGADPNVTHEKYSFTAMQWAERALRTDAFYQQVIDILKKANPRPAAKPETPAKAKADKKPAKVTRPSKKKSNEPIRPPDFTNAAKDKEFQKALAELEEQTGSKCQELTNVPGGSAFHIHSSKRKTFDFATLQSDLLKRGCLIFNIETDANKRIAALPTQDRYDALRAMLTNGANEGHMPEDIIDWLKTLEKDQPFILTTAGFDFVGGTFTTKLADPEELAQKMIDFCSDLLEGGGAEEIAEELLRSKAFFFWWD